MICVTACEKAAAKKFRAKLKPHLSAKGPATAVALRQGSAAQGTTTLGEAVRIPESDIHHLLDTHVMLAISHAIEDLALETGEGELISTFQNLANFAPNQARYVELAQKLDAVRVWGAGAIPRGAKGIDFIVAEDPKIQRYWIVLFDSPHCRALLFCRQINKTTVFEEKKFVGFYSFNPYLVQSVRWRFNLLSCGLSRYIAHWEKQFPLPDLKMRDMEQLLKHEPKPKEEPKPRAKGKARSVELVEA